MPTLRTEHHAGGKIIYISREAMELAPLLRCLTAAGADGDLVVRDVERDMIVIRFPLNRAPEEGDRAQPPADDAGAVVSPPATGGRR